MNKQASRFKSITTIIMMLSVVFLVLMVSAYADEETVRRITRRLDDEFSWSPLTLSMCIAGWAISLLTEWGAKWQMMRICFKDFILDSPPRVVLGFVSVLSCYVLIPEIITLFQLDMKMNNLGAFVTGLSADVIVHRIRGLIPRSPEAREIEREKVKTRLNQGTAHDAERAASEQQK